MVPANGYVEQTTTPKLSRSCFTLTIDHDSPPSWNKLPSIELRSVRKYARAVAVFRPTSFAHLSLLLTLSYSSLARWLDVPPPRSKVAHAYDARILKVALKQDGMSSSSGRRDA
ncbi:hypothetical protein HBI56_193150 [Parastagonospora nodorum]|uniref:Uncharacterized protein n=1 Tax=Phaeosphaeria nodorum (strain SN15 / ATCC MYA-4574 / FGSC 10173) TaxID=321614 RepID=A0A7U2IA37_PHANO|nr:hypothetical protein HBH56_177190 [Parastagonospora nodorum]QRD06057.1 hypothetical protein JI435_445250 [Parastagonospora nodorum SN15]KAH3931773.1 hypothetical protein HBH54_092630 [Parastagonospora nodorum]KAH3939630.1 hypothetical protein HBH53_231800 [Parastagonospora nodorum]KAH3957478.1 hypothetical protein HBH51_223770 [Parastagonospora nodorum]